MRFRVFSQLGLLLLAFAGQPPSVMALSLAGSSECESCHEQAYANWKNSHHYQAMLPATDENVLGNFSDQVFDYGDVTSRFYRDNGKYMVETDNRDGELQAFEIAYTFGFHPLQQYLVPFDDGRLQALNIVWDSRPANEGGQRWVHLYSTPEDQLNPVDHEDMVHWTGAFQNWNSRCAVCHSTGLRKNYSSTTNSYKTTWAEINVACEACHGPASGHLEWATGDQQGEDHGFAFSLDDRGAFGPVSGSSTRTFSRLDGKRPKVQVETCAACHSRRSEISPTGPGQSFDDLYRLALIEPRLYFPDGQINDEVYVYGSFLQSKMHRRGVVCTNCHDPHSNRVRADDNSLCTQCHVGAVYDVPGHHHHDPGSTGSSCVNCHMPVKTYMVVDDRHDHSFRIPDPRLSLALGVPNTCTQCHEEQDAQWAITALESWGVSSAPGSGQASVLNAAWARQADALPDLLALANQDSNSPMLRSSAMIASQNYPSQDVLTLLPQWLASPDPLVKASAVRSMDWLPVAQKYALLRKLVSDDSKGVRMAVARQLSSFPADELPQDDAGALTALWREYVNSMLLNADMPEEQINLGVFHLARGDVIAAEKAYRQALKLSPVYVPALLNLADLYRANGMDQQAEPLLLRAVELAPGQAAVQHAMGLLLIRLGSLAESLPYLQSAAETEPRDIRYSYVYAVALWEAGNRDLAVQELESALNRDPGNRDIVSALASYYQQLGEIEKFNWLKELYAPGN